MLGAFYQHLLAPVEAHLEGATEVLIIPHKKLFEVPWAAFFDSQTGQYLIQRFVLRVAPSLRVARTAADALLPSRTLAQSGIRAVARLALALKSTGIARRHAHVTRTCDGAGVSGRSGRAGRAGARRHCLCKVKVKWLKNKYDVEIDLDGPAELFMTQVRFSGGVMCDHPTPRCMGATDSAKSETHTHGCLISTRTNVQIPLLRIVSVHVDVHLRASTCISAAPCAKFDAA